MHGLRCSLLALVLMGCAAKQQGVRVEYVDKPVIVEKACLEPGDIPTKPGKLSATPTPSNLETALSVALAKVSEWTRYGNRADPIMKSCSK